MTLINVANLLLGRCYLCQRKTKTRNIFAEISADDAFAILRLRAKDDPKVANRIEQIAIEY
jgi:hypothetical protein